MKKIEKEKINLLIRKIENKEFNFEYSVKKLDEMCEGKNAYAIYKKALLILKGVGYRYDLEKAINLLTLSSVLGTQEASFQLGLIFFNKGKFLLSERYLLKSFKIKDSFYYLGLLEEKGLGKTKSLHRAFEWYLKGAKANNYECAYKVGCFFIRGLGIKRNEEKGVKYLQIALKNKVDDKEDIYGMLLKKEKI